MEFHILCGLPGSGKSTLSKRLSTFIVSPDNIRKFLWEDESVLHHDKLVFRIAKTIIRYMLSLNKNVVFDATNLSAKTRKRYINLAKQYKSIITVHWINCPLQTAIERNNNRSRKVPEAVIKSFYNRLQIPSISEGMDIIKIYDENLDLVDTITDRRK